LKVSTGVVILVLFVSAALFLSSAQFKDWVRGKVVAKLDSATGGRTEIGAFDWNVWKLELEASNLTIHGLEPAGEVPYLHVDRVYLRAHIVSLLKRDIHLRYLELDRPVLHLIVYPDGHTNQPTPKVRVRPGEAIQSIFNLAANRIEVKNGVAIVNDRSTPLDFAASDFAIAMGFQPGAQRYDGTLHVGKADASITDLRPFSFIADAKFSLFPNHADLNSLTLRSGDSRLDVTGTLNNFSDPKINATFNAKVEARLVGSIDRLPAMRGGVFNATGEAHYAREKFGASGRITAGGLEWISHSARIHNMTVASDFTLDKERIVLTHLVANTMGGTLEGTGEVTNWTVEQHGTLHLLASNLNLGAIADAGSTPKLPLNSLNLAGTVGGSVTVTWVGPASSSVADLALQAVPPANVVPGQLPVTAALRGVYYEHTGLVDIASLNLQTPATRVVASGALGSKTADLKLSASTSNLGEINPVIAARAPDGLPVDIRGEAAFDGTIRGKFSSPTIKGHVQLANFDSLIGAPPVAEPPEPAVHELRGINSTAAHAAQQPAPRRIHWDSFTGDLQYSPSQLAIGRGLLSRGSAQLKFDVSAQLQDGQFTRNSPLELRTSVTHAPFADFQGLVGYNYPVTGDLNFTAHVTGTFDDPQGSGDLRLTDATLYGQPMARLSCDVKFANHEAQLSNIDAVQNHAHVLGSAAYDLADGSFRFDLRGDNFNLANLRAIQKPQFRVAGMMSFIAHGSGSPQAPIINADLSLHSLAINGDSVGNLIARARTSGEIMTVNARSDVEGSDFKIEGTIRLRDDYSAQLAASFTHLDLDPLLRVYLKGQLSGHSASAGKIALRGPLKRPQDLELDGEITDFHVPVGGIKIRNQDAIRFALSRQLLELRQLHLIAEDTDFVASGSVDLGNQHNLNLRADGKLNLKLVQSLDPNFSSYGLVTLNTQVSGTAANPMVDGQVRVTNAGISYIELPNGLSDINGTLVFNRDRLQIQNMTARTGGGTLDLSGYVTYARMIGFNLQARAHDVRLRYPPGVSAMADATLRLSGTAQTSLLSGDLTLTRFGLNPQFDFASYVASSSQPVDVSNAASPLNNVRVDIHVTSTPGLQVQTSLARLSGNLDLRIRGTVAHPSVLGRVAIIEGDIFFNGTKYRLERGDVTFTNPTRVQPYLDIQASTRVRDYDITIGFHGPIDKLSTSYRSDPPLATADIIALLAFGRTREESAMRTASNQNFTETASNAILGQALNATVSNRVQRLFGVSRLKIDPEVGGAENNPSGARVTIEQQVSNNMTVTYITDVARSNQQIISVEYNVTRAVSIVAVRDQNGIVSFDVRIRHRKR
jgi:translocation and assembly module TamB